MKCRRREKYEKTFDLEWEKIHNEGGWGKYPSEDVIRFVARNYYEKERKKIKILDMGCGQGANTWFLSKEGFDTYAFDGSESAVKKANEYLKKFNYKAQIICSDAANIPYENNYFDVEIDAAMICGNTVEGIKNILKEANRVLKVGGRMFSTGLFNEYTTGYGTGEKLENNTYRNIEIGSLAGRGTVHYFNKEEIINFWEEAGFIDIKIDSLIRSEKNSTEDVGYYIMEATKK